MVNSEKAFLEDPVYAKNRKITFTLNSRFKFHMIFSVLYGLFFINYIDIIIPGSSYSGYHLWLAIMYFLPFIPLTIFFPKNWQLTLGLGLVASLMNDVFYGPVRNLIGVPVDLTWYYSQWLIPGNTTLFQLNLGFIVIPVLSWMMALSIYARIPIVYFLLRAWKRKQKPNA
jgi:hypothetical protein